MKLLQQKAYKICITDLDELKQRLRTEWVKLDHVVIAAAIHHCVVNSSKAVMQVLHTFCCNILTCCNQLDSNLVKLEATVEVG